MPPPTLRPTYLRNTLAMKLRGRSGLGNPGGLAIGSVAPVAQLSLRHLHRPARLAHCTEQQDMQDKLDRTQRGIPGALSRTRKLKVLRDSPPSWPIAVARGCGRPRLPCLFLTWKCSGQAASLLSDAPPTRQNGRPALEPCKGFWNMEPTYLPTMIAVSSHHVHHVPSAMRLPYLCAQHLRAGYVCTYCSVHTLRRLLVCNYMF